MESSPIFGREHELAQMESWARASSPSLVITGPGGIGKTTLLRAFMAGRHGGAIVDCTTCTSVEEVGIAIADALDLDLVSGQDARRLAKRAAAIGVTILALDNLERLTPQAKELEPFLKLVPHVLVTSRIALSLPGYTTMNLAPLASGHVNAPAVQLLRARSALAAEPTHEEQEILTRIADLSDGIPLALELAATQIAMFGATWTAERLAARLAAVESEGDATSDDRGRTLLTTFHGSWELLPERERQAVARLSFFSDVFALDEAARLLVMSSAETADVLATLVRHSWVIVDTTRLQRPSARAPAGQPRFRILVPLREFARRMLATSDDAERSRDLYEEIVLAITEPASGLLRGKAARAAILHIGRFYSDLLSFMSSPRSGAKGSERHARATYVAASWALEAGAHLSFNRAASSEVAEAALAAAPRPMRLAAAVAHAKVEIRVGHLREGRARAEQALTVAEDDNERAACLLVLARASAHLGELEIAYELAMEALELEPKPQVACDLALTLAGATRWLGLDREALAAVKTGAAAARCADDVATESSLLAIQGALYYDARELAKAEAAVREAIELVDDQSRAGRYAQAILADILSAKGSWDEADACLDHIIQGTEEHLLPYLAAVFSRAHLRVKRGRFEEARESLESLAGAGEQLSIRVLVDALVAVVYAKMNLFNKAERAADAVYARPSGSMETVVARTVVLGYELERLRIDPHDDESRHRVQTTLSTLSDARERGRSWLSSSADVRGALSPMRDALGAAGFQVPSDREEPPELIIEDDVARLGARSLALKQRHALRQILSGLLDAPRGTELDVERIFALGWPGERVVQRAMRNRVHVALATIRRELLGERLIRSAAGYSIDATVRVVRRQV